MAREQKTKQAEQPKNKLENNRQSVATYRGDNTTGAPLTVEVTATTGRLEALEENRKVTLQAGFHFGDDVHSAWGDIAKTKVVSTSDTSTYRRGDRGQPWRTSRERAKKGDR